MLEVQKQKRVSPFSSKLFSRLIAFTAAFLVFALLFGSMFQMFESISMQAMLRMNEEFSAQASTISDSMQSIINTLGIQMFYISSTAKLRKSTSLTQNERVFALRELWQYAMSGSMLHSIYVFNPKLNYVYTTDNDYMSASMDGFYDQDAVALYRQRSPENRMRLYHRTFRENGEDYGSEWYSYLVYEVTASGKTGESAVMLNLNADWFREHLLNFQGENYVIVSSDSYVVASQREELNAMSLSLLGRIGEQKRGYLIERLNGKRTICFFSPLDVNDWYCLRYVAYADCLPGLAKIRSYAWIALTLIACALLSALGVALIRVYDPYRRMTAALNRTHEVENVQQAAEQVEKIVATSLNRKREDALRLWVNGQPSEEGLVRFPAVPILLEMSPDERLRGLLAQETPDCVVCAVGEASLALCAPAAGQSAVEICLHLATQMHCRCYYGLPIQSPSELPARYQALLERKKLRFFYPGQQVFAQTAAESAGKSAEELETALNTCFNTAKTGKEIAFGSFEEFTEPGLRFGNPVPGHFQQQVVLIFVAPGLHAFREMRREDVAQLLHKAVGKVGFKERHFFQHRVGAALHGEEERHFVGAELVDHQKRIFAVLLSDVINIAVHIFTGDRQMLEFCQNMTADLRQHLRLIGADVKHLLLFLCREGIEAHRKNGQLARAAGGFKQAIRIGVIARRCIGIDIAHAGDVIVVVSMTTVVLDVFIFHPIVVELTQDLLRRNAKINTQMVDQGQLAIFVDTGKK